MVTTAKLRNEQEPSAQTDVRLQSPAIASTPVSVAEFNTSAASHTGRSSREERYRSFVLFASDVFAVLTSCLIGGLAWLALSSHSNKVISDDLVLLVTVVPLAVTAWFSYHWGHYHKMRGFWQEVQETTKIIFYIAAISVGYLYLAKTHISRIWLLTTLTSLLVLIPVCRYLLKSYLFKANKLTTKLVVLGTGINATEISRTLSGERLLGYEIITSIYDDHHEDPLNDQSGLLASDGLIESIKSIGSPQVLIAPESYDDISKYKQLIDKLLAHNITCMLSPPMHGLPVAGTELMKFVQSERFLLRFDSKIAKPSSRIMKRAFDIVVSTLLLILLSPLMAVLAILIKRDGGPVFYAQRRIGRNGVRFDCFKFRSMRPDSQMMLERYLENNPEAAAEWRDQHKLRNDPRVTKIGLFLRASSLDELPQLVNAFVGNMSLVGPRPIVDDEIAKYGQYFRYYTDMSPGITGLWQVSGRSNTSYAKRVALDVSYAKNWSLWDDISILIRTTTVVFGGDDAY